MTRWRKRHRQIARALCKELIQGRRKERLELFSRRTNYGITMKDARHRPQPRAIQSVSHHQSHAIQIVMNCGDEPLPDRVQLKRRPNFDHRDHVELGHHIVRKMLFRDIRPGEDWTFNYGGHEEGADVKKEEAGRNWLDENLEEDRIPCLCGASSYTNCLWKQAQGLVRYHDCGMRRKTSRSGSVL